MKYFELVHNECIRLNKVLDKRYRDVYFISSSQTEIIYANNNHNLIFVYAPSQYEYGNTMFLKGLRIRLDCDVEREYSLIQVTSFLQSDCVSFSEDYKTLPLDQLMDQFDLFQNLHNNHKGWELKYKEYLKQKYPW